MENNKFTIGVICMTFNHAPYIEDAMNGFCMQETTFPYVCMIIDDASTDNEPEIIKNYLKSYFDLDDKLIVRNEVTDDYYLIFAQHKINRNCFFAVIFLKYNHYSIKKTKMTYLKEWNDNVKYRAICEGDDYWIDKNKLQKQVDFLENHPEHSLCIHAYRRDIYKDNEVISMDIHKYPTNMEIIPDRDVINGTGMFGATASMVYRKSSTQDYPDWAKRAPVSDRPLKFVLFARGHIAYLDTVMSVYRVGVPGSWTKRVNGNRKEEKKTRARFVQLLVDFDEWTDQKYHKFVYCAIREYKYTCLKKDIISILYIPYKFMRQFWGINK